MNAFDYTIGLWILDGSRTRSDAITYEEFNEMGSKFRAVVKDTKLTARIATEPLMIDDD